MNRFSHWEVCALDALRVVCAVKQFTRLSVTVHNATYKGDRFDVRGKLDANIQRCSNQRIGSINGCQPGFSIYHPGNSTKTVDKKVPAFTRFWRRLKSPSRPFRWVISNAALGTIIPFKTSLHINQC